MFLKNKLFVSLSVCLTSVFLISGCQTPSETKTESSVAPSQLKLPALFSDNMVLQQGMNVPIWGWANDGEKITVTFRNQKVSTQAKNGKWKLNLRNLKAGGPDTLTVSSQNKIQLTNVLVGEVWVCSGQSNMEWPLSRSFESKDDIASSANPKIHLFHVPKLKADAPVDDVKANWTECNSQTSPSISAVGYYFARELQKARQVPVGLIESDWGGSPAEVWMSKEALEKNPRYKSEILDPYPAAEKNYQNALAALEKEKLKPGNEKKAAPWKPWKPTELYNGMIAPLVPYAIKGAIWYQGESNAGRAEQYRTLFPDMIRNWRSDWKNDFTFLSVQLAPFMAIQPQPGESAWAELREAQSLSTKVLPKVGMAVITDVGEERDIHPTKKKPVGERLALAARGIAYGEKIVYSGPTYKDLKIHGDKTIVTFDHVGTGLKADGKVLKGFSICGPDKKFVWAIAEIQSNNTIAVSSPNVSNPVAVRYGWADFPVVNLWNNEGLPASPFRTDDFPMITAPKK